MKRSLRSCCGNKISRVKSVEPGIPELVRNELERLGGFEALAGRIPAMRDLEENSRVHRALADPIRLAVLYLLRDQPLCVCIINRFLCIGDSKLSYHLTILRENGLIKGEYCGNWIIYSLTGLGRNYVI